MNTNEHKTINSLKKIFILLLIIGLQSCKKDAKINIHFSKPMEQNKEINLQIENINDTDFDQIQLSIDGKKLKNFSYKTSISFKLNENYKLGEHQITLDFFKKNKEITKAQINSVLYAGIAPKLLKYKLINTYPHDINAFIEGLEFSKDTLFESTGRNGASSLRKVDFKTGKIYRQINLDNKYFGEGISILHDTIYQLTYLSGEGFMYNRNFKKIGDFSFKKSKEGWGMTHDKQYLYMSDGTEKIWQINPKTMLQEDFINVYTNKNKIQNINELEWVNGKFYTNVWMKNALAIIDQKTGAVENIIDLSELHKKVTQHPNLDVLNGIAYDSKTGHFFVTGKMWDKLFEIEIVK